MPANPNEKAQSAMDAARAKNAESAESACIDAKYFFLAIGTSLVAFILASFVGVVPISMDTALKWSCIVMIAIAAGKLIYDRFEQRIIAAVIAAEAYLKSGALAIAIVLIDPVVRFIRSLFAEKIEYITTFTFDSAYSLVQGKEGAFLAACTKAIKVATCIFVHPGSVVLGIKHLGDEAAAAIKEIQKHGLWINSPAFPKPLVPISSETEPMEPEDSVARALTDENKEFCIPQGDLGKEPVNDCNPENEELAKEEFEQKKTNENRQNRRSGYYSNGFARGFFKVVEDNKQVLKSACSFVLMDSTVLTGARFLYYFPGPGPNTSPEQHAKIRCMLDLPHNYAKDN